MVGMRKNLGNKFSNFFQKKPNFIIVENFPYISEGYKFVNTKIERNHPFYNILILSNKNDFEICLHELIL